MKRLLGIVGFVRDSDVVKLVSLILRDKKARKILHDRISYNTSDIDPAGNICNSSTSVSLVLLLNHFERPATDLLVVKAQYIKLKLIYQQSRDYNDLYDCL